MANPGVDTIRQKQADTKRAIDPAASSRISGDAVKVLSGDGQTDKQKTKDLAKSRAMSKADVEKLHAKFAAARAAKKAAKQ